ncbi:hypothetical protein SPRG_19032 [Saprolegnia parasitica CBS 223.65]|uniref:FYVE-type domain-containing protein n=1 Tax=Saprolegnia parasitica (strain CBS 223.65) TaxID=695850 RepID=A0A067D6B4_SAPPC|nr:hypothetical protein SPRG_19032 [Saprolegnia parasitica CBS 223.65]KDO34186.1 hypothetical protein SPRG_19032 [Saprolegnia parasitica CBS 223.65]|eukprot:XP_012195231.1 hypothetical protein SPRG_19032 [Saprolegnia parasitica CBS 223.65]
MQTQAKKPPLLVHASRIHHDWMRHASDCIVCTKPFSLLRRRHHCHICGGIVCRSCSEHETLIVLPVMQVLHSVRVCVVCLDHCDTNGAPGKYVPRHRTPPTPDTAWSNPWPEPPTPADEPARLRFLSQIAQHFGAWHEFDRVCEMTSSLLRAPVMAVSLIDATHQHFLARIGLVQADIVRHVSLCAHLLCTNEPTAVPNLTESALYRHNPMVTGSAHIRFYASVPLRSPSTSLVIGTVFVMDTAPRTLLDCGEALRLLDQVAHAVMLRIESDEVTTAGRLQAIQDMTTQTRIQVDHIATLSQRGL